MFHRFRTFASKIHGNSTDADKSPFERVCVQRHIRSRRFHMRSAPFRRASQWDDSILETHVETHPLICVTNDNPLALYGQRERLHAQIVFPLFDLTAHTNAYTRMDTQRDTQWHQHDPLHTHIHLQTSLHPSTVPPPPLRALDPPTRASTQ